MSVTPEHYLLVVSLLIFIGILAGKIGTRFGLPALLLFLFTGLIFGPETIGLKFLDTYSAQYIGVIALSVILFSGGMDTKTIDVHKVYREGLTLSTLGVIITTVIFGAFLYWMGKFSFTPLHLSFPISLLLAATMSSTDSASVFGILRSNNMHLKQNLRPTLELESGSNDPMAYMLTIALIQYITAGANVSGWDIVGNFMLQFAVGICMGMLLGRFAVYILNKINIDNYTLYPIILVCIVFFTYASTSFLKGNGYLAVYITGIIVGNKKLVHKKSIQRFFDGFTWLLQIILFITLGLLANIHEVFAVATFALLAGLFMIFMARPLAVFLCLIPFKGITFKGKAFLSWVGLRGAVPIIFATYPMMSNVPGADKLFNVVFFITFLSLLIQGSSIPRVAQWLKLDEIIEANPTLFGVKIPETTGAQMEERLVTERMLDGGNKLMEIDLKEEELVILVRRGDRYMVPKGKLELHSGDVLLIVSEKDTITE